MQHVEWFSNPRINVIPPGTEFVGYNEPTGTWAILIESDEAAVIEGNIDLLIDRLQAVRDELVLRKYWMERGE